jgi:hypothetical protein
VSATAAVWWASLAAVIVVLGLTGLQLARVGRELARIERRIAGYADLPIVAALVRAEASAARIEAAVAQIEPLAARARAAVEEIKRGPLPREVVVAYARVRAEIDAFRAVARPRRRG